MLCCASSGCMCLDWTFLDCIRGLLEWLACALYVYIRTLGDVWTVDSTLLRTVLHHQVGQMLD